MAIITEKDKKRQKTLLIVLGVVVIVALVVMYLLVWSKGSNNSIVVDIAVPQEEANIPNAPTSGLSATVLETKLKNVDLNIDFFNQVILSFLKPHGDLPVKKGEAGRLNPFIPQ